MLLDLNLPGMSGLDVLRQLRQDGNQVPVLILTARDGIEDRVAGLDAGADDYVTKPFELPELAARVRAFRPWRRAGQAQPLIEVGLAGVRTPSAAKSAPTASACRCRCANSPC